MVLQWYGVIVLQSFYSAPFQFYCTAVSELLLEVLANLKNLHLKFVCGVVDHYSYSFILVSLNRNPFKRLNKVEDNKNLKCLGSCVLSGMISNPTCPHPSVF